jgi:phosphotransacetylase
MADVKRIVLPEGSERAPTGCTQDNRFEIAEVTLLGNQTEIQNTAEQTGTDLAGIAAIDPKTSEKLARIRSFL